MIETDGVGLDLGHGREDITTATCPLVLNGCGIDPSPVLSHILQRNSHQRLWAAMHNHTSLKWITLGYHHTETVGSEVTRVLECELVETEVNRTVRGIVIQMFYSIEVPFELRECRDFLLCGVEVDPVSHSYISEELYNIGSGLEVGGGRGRWSCWLCTRKGTWMRAG